MPAPFVLDTNLRIQQVLGLEKVKQQLAGIHVGGIGQTQSLSTGLKNVGTNASVAAVSLTKSVSATTKLGRSAKTTGRNLNKAAKSAGNFGDQMFLAGKRYAAFLSATVLGFKAFQVIGAGTKSVLDFDQAMVSLAQIMSKSIKDVGYLSQQFLDLSVSTGTSAAEIANAAKLLAQAGFRGRELTEAVNQLAKVPLTPIFESMEQAVDGAIAAMRQFEDEGLTVESVFDKMIKVSDNYAASFPEIIEGLKRGGSAFHAIGGTLDEFIAAFTTIRSVTRESASAVGTSLKTVSSRLADPKIIAFLETKGIRLIEDGQFVKPIEALRRIGEGLEKVRDFPEKEVDIAVKLGGRRQVSRFLAIAQNMETTNEIIGVSKNSFNEFGKVAEQGLQAVSKQLDILIAKGKRLAIELGDTLFIPFIKGFAGAADGAISLFSALKPILPIAAKIGTIFAGIALFRGAGRLIGPGLGRLVGSAAPISAGAKVNMALGMQTQSQVSRANVMASPFAQAGLLLAASEATSSLLRTADGADTLASTLVSSVSMIVVAMALLKGQSIAQFAAMGGLFSTAGRMGKLGGAFGSLATVGAVAAPFALLSIHKSAQGLTDKIIDAATNTINTIDIDSADAGSVERGVKALYYKIGQTANTLKTNADPNYNPSIKKSLQGATRAISNVFSGDFGALISRGGLTDSNVNEQIQQALKKTPEVIKDLVDGIANSIIVDGKIGAGPAIERSKLVETAAGAGLTPLDASKFADIVIEAAGGIDAWSNSVQSSAKVIQQETEARNATIKRIKTFVPTQLVGQLLQFSKAVDATTRAINISSKLFETQIAEITGGIQAPSFDFDFGSKRVENLIRQGGLQELFAFTPDIPRFVGSFKEVEDLLDNFIINISNLPTENIDITEEIDKFFEFQKNVPQVIKDNFEDFFAVIAGDIIEGAEDKFVDIDAIKKRFETEFKNIGAGTSQVVVESVVDFMNTTFAQIEDELNRLATVRQFELSAPVRPESQTSFLRKQLARSGVDIGGVGRAATSRTRGTLEELDLIRRERVSKVGPGRVPGLLPTPSSKFFQGRDQGLVDIAGDERIRQQVRDSFKDIITESSILKKRLADLQPGAEGFLAASNRAKELSRATIELQTTMEALDHAAQRAVDSELKTLSLRQQLETSQVRARVEERVRTGVIEPIEAERELFDLAREQGKAQAAIQERYDTIVEKDNTLRVNLAKEISQNTKTQADIVRDFDVSTTIFADATRIQATTTDLMRQYISEFGQAVVDFSNLSKVDSVGGIGVTPSQIRSGAVTLQQANEEFNRSVNEGNSINIDKVNEILEALYDRERQLKTSTKNGTATPVSKDGKPIIDDQISQLTDSLDGLRLAIKEPNEITLISDQRIELDLSTLPSDIKQEVLPLLEEAGQLIAKTVTRKAMESLASKSDSEVSIAANGVAQEMT